MSVNEGVEPFTPAEALTLYGSDLTEYEKTEILEYPTIYYVGQRCLDKVESPASGPNNGYDEDNGEYRTVTGDHLAYRYEIVETLGSGAFGQVVKAIDHSDNTLVAIKLIRNRRKITLQAKSEINILRHVREEDPTGRFGIVIMFDDFVFRNHVCIVYEILGCNLYDEMKSHNFYPMKMYAVRQIAARVLVSLTFLWKENIMHCDLKPENILIKGQETTSVRVVDLGSACYDTSVGFMYIQSRFYRAPEVIMGSPYGRQIDLWSYACILCELATGYPVFPGEDEADQLFSIMEYLGPPPEEIVAKCRFKNKYFNMDNTPKVITNPRGEVRVPGSRSLADFLALPEDSDFVSFVKQFFVWDPKERVTPREAMQHPWIVEEFVFTKSKANHEDSLSKNDEGDDDPFKQSATAGNGVIRTRPARTAAPIPQSAMSDASSASLNPGTKPGNLVISGEVSQTASTANGTKSTAAPTATTAATQPPRSSQPLPLTQQQQLKNQPHPMNGSSAGAPPPHVPSQPSQATRSATAAPAASQPSAAAHAPPITRRTSGSSEPPPVNQTTTTKRTSAASQPPANVTSQPPVANRSSAANQPLSSNRSSAAASQPAVNGHSQAAPLRHVAKPDPPPVAAKSRQVTRLFPTAGLKKPVPPRNPPAERVERALPGLAPSQHAKGSSCDHMEPLTPKSQENGESRTSRRSSADATAAAIPPPQPGESVQDRIKMFEDQLNSTTTSNPSGSPTSRTLETKDRSQVSPRSTNTRYSMNDVQDSLQGNASRDKQAKGSDPQAMKTGAVPRPSTTTETGVNNRRTQLEEIPSAESAAKETVYCPTTRRRIAATGQKGKLNEAKMVPDANQTQLPSIDK